MTNRRRRRPEDDQAPEERRQRSGWAHFERAGLDELRFAEWCPSPHGPHGDCGSTLRHGWRGDQDRRRALRDRLRATGEGTAR